MRGNFIIVQYVFSEYPFGVWYGEQDLACIVSSLLAGGRSRNRRSTRIRDHIRLALQPAAHERFTLETKHRLVYHRYICIHMCDR